jgi:hypothetical protein
MKHSISSRKSEQNGNMNNNKNLKQDENKSLEHHLKQVKQENYGDTFPKIENWLYRTGIQLSNQTNLNENLRNERKLQKMKKFFFANKLRLVYTVVALALLVGACNMPVTQTETAGQMMVWSMPAGDKEAQSKVLALPWLKDAKLTANENTSDGKTEMLYTAVLPNTTEEQVRAYAKELESIAKVSYIKITPMNYDVKRPLYSAALDNFFSIKIDATGMSDQELEREVAKQLKEQGVDMKFQFKTGPDGRRDIFIEKTEEDKLKDPRTFELTIDDNNGNEKIKLFTKKADPKQFEGKTDREIREMVKKENPELQDKDIKIIRDGDKVQVRVELDKKEVK